jgi:Fe-S-cluster containining protein
VIDPDNYDCQSCGACCISDFDAVDYVHLLEEDLARLTPEEIKTYVYTEQTFGSPQSSMKTAYDDQGNCRCKALKGTVGKNVSCAIYDRRPNVCRNFEPEVNICDYARQIAFGVSHR